MTLLHFWIGGAVATAAWCGLIKGESDATLTPTGKVVAQMLAEARK